MERISVIVPMYNVEKYLKRCLDSICAQTFTGFEVILVDDGSTDMSGEICEKYANERIDFLVIHQNNQGQARARNLGLDYLFEYNKSDWVTFVDSDDWINDRYLEVLYGSVKKYNTGISICGYKEAVEKIEYTSYEDIHISLVKTEEIYCKHNTLAVVPWGKLYNKACFNEVRYPVGKICEDEYLTYKILFMYSEIPFINNSLYNYFCNEAGVSKSMWSPRRLDSLEAMQNQIDYFRDHGLHQAYNRSIFNAAMNISRNYMEIGILEDAKKKKKYRKMLQFELRKILRYKDAKVILPFSDYKPIYEIAYPHFMKQYWRVQSVKSKFKR